MKPAAAVLCVVALIPARAFGQTPSLTEDDVKAAFLYNFAKYVDWPNTAGSDAFRVCVVADAGLEKRVDNLVAGETIDGKAVRRETPAPEGARGCHILFIGDIESERIDHFIAAVQGAPVLTVGESPDFLNRGGMIAFVHEGDRVRFDINNAAAQQVGVTVSSRLLRLARRVGVPEGRQ